MEMTLDQQKAMAMAAARQRMAATAPAPEPEKQTGLANNFAAGTIEGVTGGLAMTSDPGDPEALAVMEGLGMKGPTQRQGTPAEGQAGLHQLLDQVGLNPERVEAGSDWEQFARTGGHFAAAALGGKGGIINRVARVATPTVGATVGRDMAGGPGELVGGLLGFGAAGLLTKGGEAAYNSGKAMLDARTAPPTETAMGLVKQAFERDKVPLDVAEQTVDRFGNKPVALLDAGGSNVARLARTVHTLVGNGSEKITKFLAERQADQNSRIIRDIHEDLADGSDVFEVAKKLNEERATTSRPLYKRALQGGSIAPLEDQLRSELALATGRKGTIAREMKQIEEKSPGALVARGAVGREIREHYVDLHQQLQRAEADRAVTLEMFQKAKGDASSNAPGAVWSPRVQEFLASPEVKTGIKHGLMIQRREALAAGEKFDPTEYGVTGVDEAGDPIVSKVPNMRLLDAGKKGIDAQLEVYRDKTTGRLVLDEAGRALDDVRKAYVAELDRLNPDYKVAREAWAGPSQSLDAIALGKDFTDLQPEQLVHNLGKMTEDQRNFFKIGAARRLQEMIHGAADNRDAAARVFGNQTIRDQIDAVFGNGSATKFAEKMTPENMMTATNRFVRGNSASLDKAAEIADTAGPLERGVQGFAKGGLRGAVSNVADIPARISSFFNGLTPEVREAVADILTSHEPVPGLVNAPPGAVNGQAAVPGLLNRLATGKFELLH